MTISTFTRALIYARLQAKQRALIAAIGVEFHQERIHAEHGRHYEYAAVTEILNVSGMNDGINQQALRIDENMPLLALDLLSCVVARRINPKPPFSALLTLWLSITAGRWGLGFPANRFAAFYIELMMYEIERAIPTPAGRNNRTTSSAAAGLWDGPPLTTGGENIHEAIHNLAHGGAVRGRAAPAWRDQRFDQLPFVVGEVAGIAQMAAVIPRAILVSSSSAAPKSGHLSWNS